MKNEELEKIKQEFLRVKEMGYLKNAGRGPDSIEYTFKKLITLPKNSSKILIRRKKDYTSNYIRLFKASPNEKDDSLRLLKNYGYLPTIESKTKVLHSSIQANCSTFVGSKIFKLELGYEERKIYLKVSDKSFNAVEKSVFWPFNQVIKNLKNKYEYIVLLKTWTKLEGRTEYYKYYDISFYKLKTPDEIIKLIASGNIRITFKAGFIPNVENKEITYNHGPFFEIQEVDFLKLFNEIKI